MLDTLVTDLQARTCPHHDDDAGEKVAIIFLMKHCPSVAPSPEVVQLMGLGKSKRSAG